MCVCVYLCIRVCVRFCVRVLFHSSDNLDNDLVKNKKTMVCTVGSVVPSFRRSAESGHRLIAFGYRLVSSG